MKIIIRQEMPVDFPLVNRVIQKAFEKEPMSDGSEVKLVEKLRTSDAFIPALSLVAEIDQKIVGHILLTKIEIIKEGEGSEQSLALAPVSVLPTYQRKGIGSSLIKAGHKIAKSIGYQSIILIGHEDYYPRFGYLPTSNYGIALPFEAPEINCMAIELVKDGLKNVSGVVRYPKEFFEI